MKRIAYPALLILISIVLLFLLFGHLEIWFESLLDRHQNDLSWYCLISFLVLSADIVLPVPSSILMFLNGVVLGIFGGFLLSMVSAMTSSLIGYYLGARMSRFTDRFFQSQETATARHLLEHYGWLAIIVSRGLPILAETVAMVTGNLQYKFSTFFWSNLIGFIPVCLIYALAGHYSFATQSLLIAFAINIFLAALFWLADRKLSTRHRTSPE